MSGSALPELLAASRERLAERGLNLWGVASTAEFDACLPCDRRVGCRGFASIVVVGSGGRGLWERLGFEGLLDPEERGRDPIDRWSRRCLEDELTALRDQGHRAEALFPFTRRPADFLRLGEMAGLGIVSPVVPFLLHPRFGPWISLRGALLVEDELEPTGEVEGFEPCQGCAAPCLTSCPVGAYRQHGRSELRNCAEHRHDGGCVDGCSVRRACPVGADERYSPEEEAYRHAHSLPTLRRWFGLGAWRIVPGFLRRL